MTETPDYKTLQGGSIDYAHYDRVSREIRSRDAMAASGFLKKTLVSTVKQFASAMQKLRLPRLTDPSLHPQHEARV